MTFLTQDYILLNVLCNDAQRQFDYKGVLNGEYNRLLRYAFLFW